MRKNAIAERFQKLLNGLKIDSPAVVEHGPQYFGQRDAAVLKVAMMVAALDGSVTDAELAAFEKQAKKCSGYTAQAAKDLFRDCLRTAGYIELASRTLPAGEVQGIFIEEAKKSLSGGFAKNDAAGIRNAFVTWIAMAMSDGEFSANERKAIGAFASHVKGLIEARREANYRRQSLSPAFAAAYREETPDGCDLSPSFFDKAETLIAKLNREPTAAGAASELKTLIVNG